MGTSKNSLWGSRYTQNINPTGEAKHSGDESFFWYKTLKAEFNKVK
jgi:hypothetical protein